MIEQTVRPWFQKHLVNSVATAISTSKINANTITILSLITGAISALLVLWAPWFAVVFLLVSGYLDVLDGSVARLQNTSTPFSSMLDILSDRFVESFIVIALFVNHQEIAWIGLLMMMSIVVCISSFLLVGIFNQQQSHKSFYYSAGLIERAETFIFFIFMILLPSTILWLGILFTILVLWTTFYRVREFYIYTKEAEHEKN